MDFRPVTRHRLPDRRPAVSVRLEHEGGTVHATVGFDPATGAVREVFLRRGGPPGSAMDRLLDDVGVLLSRLLQLGDDPADLTRGLGRLGWYPQAAGPQRGNTLQAFVDYLINADHAHKFNISPLARTALQGAAKAWDDRVEVPAPPASIIGVVADWLARLAVETGHQRKACTITGREVDAADARDLEDFKPGGTD